MTESAPFIFEDDKIVGIDVGFANIQFSTNKVLGFGGINTMFLAEQGWHSERDTVEITEPITRKSGQVKLPSGYLFNLTIGDIRPTWTPD